MNCTRDDRRVNYGYILMFWTFLIVVVSYLPVVLTCGYRNIIKG